MKREQIEKLSKDSIFGDNLYKYVQFSSWMSWYPDLFLDMITPKSGGIKLHTDQRVYLRCVLRFTSTYGVFPRGWGKCIKGDSLIFTDKGIKEIGELFDYNTSGEETYYDTQIGIINRYGKKEKTILGLYNGKQKTKTIITNEGYEITGTYNHPVLVMNKDGNICFKKLENINKKYDYIIINRNNNLWGDNNYINAQHGFSSYYANMPNHLSNNIAKFFAYIIDSASIKNNTIIFKGNSEFVFNLFNNVINNDFNVNDNNHIEMKCIIKDEYFFQYIKSLDLLCGNSFKKEIPKFILSANKDIVSNFIRGLFDIGGIVDDNSIIYNTSSKKLVSQMQFILLNYGIISKIYYNKNDDCYSLTIKGYDIKLFKKYIGFDIDDKVNKLNIICKNIQNIDLGNIPNQKNRILNFLNDIDYNIKFNEFNDETLTYKNLDILLNLNNANKSSEYKSLKEIDDTHYYYAKIKNIYDGTNDVYDFHIPSTHSFVSNGLISHNTFDEVLAMFIVAIRYPDIELALTAQTKENAAELLKDKTNEIIKYYPLLENELIGGTLKSGTRFSKNDAEVNFKSGARIDILANAQTSKGQRRKRMNIEESALLDNAMFQDALQPIVEVPRYTIGKLGVVNPEELNQQINFFTTSGFRGSDEYNRLMTMLENMYNLNGNMVIGSDWFLACWYGRGSTKSQILEKKKTMSYIAFAQNHESRWVGAADGALVNINKLMMCRNLTKPLLKSESYDDEYYIAVDVARSESTANNQSSAAICKVRRDKSGRVSAIELPNIVNISNTKNFSTQALDVKRLKKAYNARMVICDGNGLGAGLIDELLKDCIDPITGEELGCWNTVNTDNMPELPLSESESCLFDMKAQGNQSKVVTRFVDAVDSGKLRLLQKKNDNEFLQKDRDNYAENILPYIQTDFLIDEIANLKLKILPKSITVERIVSRINKDRWSALAYAIYYIMEFCEVVKQEDNNQLQTLSDYTYL